MGCLAGFARSYGAYSTEGTSSLHPHLAARAAGARRDGFVQAAILFELANGVYLASGDGGPAQLDEARAALERSADVARAAGATTLLANTVVYLADFALAGGDLDGVTAILDELPSPVIDGSRLTRARVRIREALVALDRHEFSTADRLAHEALTALDGQDLAWDTFDTLEVLAQIAGGVGDHADAARLGGAAARLRDERVHRQLTIHQQRIDACLAAAKSELGDAAFDAAWSEGQSLDMASAVAFARRSRGERRRPSIGWDSLTPTEVSVVEAAAEGLTNPHIAERLLMSRETVKSHLSHVFTKLGVSTRTGLAHRVAERPR